MTQEAGETVLYILVFHKAFDGFVFSKTECIIVLSRSAVAVFGSLPEFPLIRTRKERSVFLGLVLENSFSFFGKLARTNGYSHLNFVNIPLLPGTAVHPDLAVLEPLIALAFFKGQEDGFQAYPMGAMRIGQVTGGIYLMRLQLAQQV